ncbi:hypothetical protein Fcan01_11367 [Folsomia candida]|uniref:Uncharacterized protein n=1 Tax=Folsomia candida TaxID=158441 RepID=A0A226EB40_FOLCA|nr:hypothetical protein Fcan01_11367 [Folsomia candida]
MKIRRGAARRRRRPYARLTPPPAPTLCEINAAAAENLSASTSDLAGFRVAQVFQNLNNALMRKPLNNLFVLLCIVCQSKSYLASVKFFENMKSLRSRNPWFKKFLTSCPPLKVGMGDGKFFDGLSAFVIWQFCVDRLINLLLMEK